MPLLNLNDAMRIYQYSFIKNPKFGFDLYRKDIALEDVIVLEKNINLKKNTPLKFNFYALLLCLDGELNRYINQYSYHIKKHSLQLIPPNTIYHFENITETTEIYILLFTESYIKMYEKHHVTQNIEALFAYHTNTFSPVKLSTSLYTRVLNLYIDINNELHEKQEDYHTLVRLIILKLLLLLKREKAMQNTPLTFQSRAEYLSHCYLELIEKHFLEYKKVSD